MDERLKKFLFDGGTVVTVNARLARSIIEASGRESRASGRNAWIRPDVLSFGAWLGRWWDQLSTDDSSGQIPLVLSRDAETVLWERVIDGDGDARSVLGAARAAAAARRAYDTALSWDIGFEGASYAWTDDVHAFARWMRRFEALCSGKGMVSSSKVGRLLLDRITDRPGLLPKRLLLAGFDELTPLQKALFDALSGAGVPVEEWSPSPQQSSQRLLEAHDAESELRLAARWARALLERSGEGETAIGVIVPDLTAHRALAERVFSEVFYPGAVSDGIAHAERAFNISAGRPLASFPVVDAALQILNLVRDCISWEDAGRLIRSPFVAGGLEEREVRSLLDARLRRRGVLTITPGQLLGIARSRVESEGDVEYRCPILADRLGRAVEFAGDATRRLMPSEWKSVFLDVLRAMGWPGDRTANSEEYQALMSLRTVLGRFAALDDVCDPMTSRSALSHLVAMCSGELFQPRTTAAPVQIMGVLESGGATFDHLWITGLHDEAWPAAPAPDPFLPLDQQKKKNIPHASAERELAFAATVTRRLLASAPDVLASYPARVEDRELKPSRLVQSLSRIGAEDLDLHEFVSPARLLIGSAALEELEDFAAPRIENGSQVRGGARVFELQAKCPFRAYAEIRLNSECLETPKGGFDAREKGMLVHLALDVFWNRLGSQSALEQPDEAIRTLVRESVEEAIAVRKGVVPGCYPDRFSTIECRRIEGLLKVLIDLERERAPFVLQKTEVRREASAGGIIVTTRVDRIDTLDDGSLVFIDYKTGKPGLANWLGDRPDEPQLPLYAVTADGDVSAVSFVQFNAENVAFCGFQRERGIAPALKMPGERSYPETWQALVDGWRQALDRLGEEHRNGDARVDPKNPSQTCRYCAQTAFCRKHELLASGAEEEEMDE